MEEQQKNRFYILDGLRGICALFVVLSHFGASKDVAHHFTGLSKVVFLSLTQNGTTAVFYFFVLAGFLMRSLYQNPANPERFISKRLARIIPLFVAVSFASSLIKVYELTSFGYISTIFVTAVFFVNMIWGFYMKHLVKKISPARIFFVYSIFWSLVYLFILKKPNIYFESLSLPWKVVLNWGVNSAFVTGLGSYINLTDSVYWSLALEVIFYIFYPNFIAKIFNVYRDIPKRYKVLMVVFLFLWIYFINFIFSKFLYFKIYYFYNFIFFVLGIILAEIYHSSKHSANYQFFKEKILYFGIISFILIILSQVYFYNLNFAIENDIKWLILSPLVFLSFMSLILNKNKYLNLIFNNKIFIWLGGISYSLYLSHSQIILAIGKLQPNMGVYEIYFHIFKGVVLSIFFAFCINKIIEKRYFEIDRQILDRCEWGKLCFVNFSKFKYILVIIFIFLQMFILLIFQNQYSWSSVLHEVTTTWDKKSDIVDLNSYKEPIKFSFQVKSESFGILELSTKYLGHTKQNEVNLKKNLAKMKVVLYDDEGKSLGESTILGWSLGSKRRDYPIGFASIVGSYDKKYSLEIFGIDQSAGDSIGLYGLDKIKIVSQVSKSILYENPRYFFDLIFGKLKIIFFNSQMWLLTSLNLIFTYVLFKVYPKKSE